MDFSQGTAGLHPIVYEHHLAPQQSMNFITCRDEFTLNDLVSYKSRCNDENLEQDRDGVKQDCTWNCEVERSNADDPTSSQISSPSHFWRPARPWFWRVMSPPLLSSETTYCHDHTVGRRTASQFLWTSGNLGKQRGLRDYPISEGQPRPLPTPTCKESKPARFGLWLLIDSLCRAS